MAGKKENYYCNGQRLHQLLVDKNISQRQLASDLNLHYNTINYWIANNDCKTITNLLKLAEILDVNPRYLIGTSDSIDTFSDLKISEILHMDNTKR